MPTAGSRERIQQGMAGQDPEAYQEMLADVRAIAILGDELGYDAVAFTEHHFHIEGIEISNNPVLLDTYVALHTKRIRVGQLGIVLPAHNPLRVAEDIAMLDHISGGRAFAGFARGYQRRWVDTLAQQSHDIHVAPISKTRDRDLDELNRAAFEENFAIVKMAWTNPTFSFKGRFWTIPPANTPWPLQVTAQYGRGVENGMLTEIGIAPLPLQKPHPPIMQPFAVSERTVRWNAQNGIMPILAPINQPLEAELYEAYRTEANAAGNPLALGENIGVLRDIIIADTDEEAMALWHNSAAFAGAAWFKPFGFDALLPLPGETPRDITGPVMFDRGHIWVGTVETVRRLVEQTLERLPVQYVMAFTYNGLMPRPAIEKTLRLFKEEVMDKIR